MYDRFRPLYDKFSPTRGLKQVPEIKASKKRVITYQTMPGKPTFIRYTNSVQDIHKQRVSY